MSKFSERCGVCQGCIEEKFWCVEWGDPEPAVADQFSDEQFGYVSRLMRGHHAKVDDVLVADPPSRTRIHPSVPGSIAAEAMRGSAAPSPFPEPYKETPLGKVQPPPPRADHQEAFTFSTTMECVVVGDRTSELTFRNVRDKAQAIERALRMVFHDQSITVQLPQVGFKEPRS